jgi:hypothetical protein
VADHHVHAEWCALGPNLLLLLLLLLTAAVLCWRRETWSTIRSAGFSSCDLTHFSATASPLFTLIAPHIAGRAVK